MGVLAMFPNETDEMRAERRRHEKYSDKLLRKIKAMVDAQYEKPYVLSTITETYKIPLEYVKLERPEIYEYIKELVEKPAEAAAPAPEVPAEPDAAA